jgi:hypothetical protein
MNIGDILQVLFFGFLSYGIPIIFWIGTLIFGIVMLKRGGGKPERFFITGAALNILGTILRIPVNYIPIWLSDRDHEIRTAYSTSFGVGIIVDIIAVAGVILLLYAFWLKFKNKQTEKVVSATTEY